MNRITYLRRLVSEVVALARQHKVWWLVPMILFFLLIGALITVSQASVPFLYTLF